MAKEIRDCQARKSEIQNPKSETNSNDQNPKYVIASEAKQSPIVWVEIASSLRSSQ
jgi:hypothetical protein